MKSLEILKFTILQWEKILLNEGTNINDDGFEEERDYLQKIREGITELEALQQRSCKGCKYGKFGADSRGIEVECTLIWHCARGNGFPDRYEPKEQ